MTTQNIICTSLKCNIGCSWISDKYIDTQKLESWCNTVYKNQDIDNENISHGLKVIGNAYSFLFMCSAVSLLTFCVILCHST